MHTNLVSKDPGVAHAWFVGGGCSIAERTFGAEAAQNLDHGAAAVMVAAASQRGD